MNINEIAKMAGVSRATVSRYLNNGYISKEKKELIQKVIDETGYQPSSFAQTLRSKKTHCIGVIIPKIDSNSISRMVAGISEVLSSTEYQLLLACTNNQEAEEVKYLNLFRENHVDGIILMGTIFTPKHKTAFKALTVPIVILSQYLEDYSCVYSDDYLAIKDLTLQLCKKSKHAAYIGVTQKDKAAGFDRKQGFLDGLKELNFKDQNYHYYEGSFNMTTGFNNAKKILSEYPDTDTILCATDTIAVGALQYLKEAKKRVPEDIQLSGFGDNTISQVTTPTLTTVHLYYKTAGAEATHMLIDMIDNSASYIRKELKLGYKIINKDSTR